MTALQQELYDALHRLVVAAVASPTAVQGDPSVARAIDAAVIALHHASGVPLLPIPHDTDWRQHAQHWIDCQHPDCVRAKELHG